MFRRGEANNLFVFEPKRNMTSSTTPEDADAATSQRQPQPPILTGASFEVLKFLSKKNKRFLEESFNKSQRLAILSNLKDVHLTTLNDNSFRCALVLQALSTEQRQVVHRIHDVLAHNLPSTNDQRIACCLLDAPPGTGKTFLIAALSLTLRKSGLYVVYSNNLVSMMTEMATLHSTTNCKFIMDVLRLNYMQVKYMWNSKRYTSLGHQIYTLILLVDSIVWSIPAVVIVDEYTILSPFEIIFYYLLGRLKGCLVVFVGDKRQLNSISRTVYHQAGNYQLICALSQPQHRYSLSKMLRQVDDEAYGRKIMQVTRVLDQCDEMHTFGMRYEIFQLFREKYFQPKQCTSLFLSPYHRTITMRIEEIEVLCRHRKRCVYYHESLVDVPSDKFPRYLLLACNHFYMYTDSYGCKYAVQLIDFTDTRVTVKRSNNTLLHLGRVAINDSFMSPEHIEWLRATLVAQEERDRRLVQFPLRFFAYTYYAAQGLTLSTETIELDADANLNSIYVGLSRVKLETQISRIHTMELLNFAVTFYFDDEYYYRVCSRTRTQPWVAQLYEMVARGERLPKIAELDQKRFKETKSWILFANNKTTNMKFERCRRLPKVECNTQLMRVVTLLNTEADLIYQRDKQVFLDRFERSIPTCEEL